MRGTDMFRRIKHLFKRINQLILVFPVWLVVGLFGAFQRFERDGWIETEEDERDYRRMY